MRTQKLTFIDLFAGCGGLSEGFLESNEFEGLAHVEWEMPMVKTLRNRLINKWNHLPIDTKKKVVHFDIQKTEELINGNWDEKTRAKYSSSNHELIVKKGIKGILNRKKVDLIIGGPPCQAYSIAGRAQDKNSMKDDYRNYLFESFVRVVKEFKPSVFVFENVPGLLSAKPGGILVSERIYTAFKEIGYEIREPKMLKDAVYSASDFGVPQKRNRIIIIGIKKSTNLNLESFYKKLDSLKNIEKKKNVYHAISKLPKIIPLHNEQKLNGKKISHEIVGDLDIKHHVPRYHNRRDISIFEKWIKLEMNGKPMDQKISFYNKQIKKKSSHAKYRNLEWNKPSPTIVAHLNKDGLMFIHPDLSQARSITIKEAALLQSFPDDYEFEGKQGAAYKMIGNAVPPLMAKNIALAISKILNNK